MIYEPPSDGQQASFDAEQQRRTAAAQDVLDILHVTHDDADHKRFDLKLQVDHQKKENDHAERRRPRKTIHVPSTQRRI